MRFYQSLNHPLRTHRVRLAVGKVLYAVVSCSLFLLGPVAQAQRITGNVSTTFGLPLPDVTVTATRFSPFEQVSDTTDAAGNYALGAILNGLDGTYRVVASKAGHTFSPALTNVTVGGRGEIVDFTAPATTPTATTSSAINVGETGATLRGTANPRGGAARAWFQYGPTTGYGSISSSLNIGSGTTDTSVTIPVTSLTPNATYHFRIVVSNSVAVVAGTDASFLTVPPFPSVVTLSPTDGGATTMRLHSMVNPNGKSTTTWFDTGTTTNYGGAVFIQNVGSGMNPTNYSQLLAGLSPGTTYHFRAVAASSGGTNYGADMLFTPVFNYSGITVSAGGYNGNAWGDFDSDGRLDVVVGGGGPSVWRNTGAGFSNISAGLPYAADGAVGWGDYNNDGRLDILMTGWNFPNFASIVTSIYRNNGNGTFSDAAAGLPPLARSAVAWGDYDNDGWQDILLCGLNSKTNPVTQVWRNTGTGFALDGSAVLPGVAFGAVAWGDYDNDGWLDILLTGSTHSNSVQAMPGASISHVWRNTGSGFVSINADLPGVNGANNRSAAAWGDYDNDGRLDIALAGTSNGDEPIAQVWRNIGSGFELNTNAPLTGLTDCSVAWGDFDNDGRLDLLLSGAPVRFGPGRVEVWRNIGGGFVNIGAGLPGVADGAATWGDYDNDGKLDIVMTGLSMGAAGQIWRNHFPSGNSQPSAPSGLTMSVSNSFVTLGWTAAADTETPVAGLTYNVRITTQGGTVVFNPMSGEDGLRRVPSPGNTQLGLTAKFKFETGVPYYWSVQAVDSGFKGSPFATESSFRILPVAAPVTATTIIPGDTDGDGLVTSNELSSVLANYWANNPGLQMTNPVPLTDGYFQFALTNDAVWNFSIEATTNLIDWEFIGPAFPVYQFFDAESTNQPQRYYRLRWP